jgi:CDK inhibitor PHO81
VFFGSYCGLSRSSPGDKLLPANRVEVDRRCTAIREAVKFAKANNLLGVVFDSTLLLHVPTLIATIKAHSLVLTASGADSGDALGYGADALLANGVLTFSEPRPSPADAGGML